MTTERNDGGPAFPQMFNTARRDGMGGMTLRDYFAAKALPQAWAAEMAEMEYFNEGAITARDVSDDLLAKRAYKMADAMLKARQA